MKSSKTPLLGFIGDKIEVERTFKLDVKLRTPPNVLRTKVEFMVVNISCMHNVILGQQGNFKTRTIISMTHLSMKFTPHTRWGP